VSFYKVGCNFSEDLLVFLSAQDNNAKNRVVEVYGSIADHSRLTARPVYRLPNITMDAFKNYVDSLKRYGIRFNYTLNASNLGSLADISRSKKNVLSLIDMLRKNGVDCFTVTLPIMAEMIREVSPDVEIEISTIAEVNSIGQIRTWHEKYDIKRVCIDTACNRDIWFLENAVNYCNKNGIVIYLIANEFCGNGNSCGTSKCIYRKQCYDLHSSDYKEKDLQEANGYPFVNCIKSRQGIESWLRLGFIRPEDIKKYNQIGIDHFKITGRTASSDYLNRVVAAYLSEEWNGNLFELCQKIKTKNSKGDIIEDTPPVIENKALDGFIDFWFENSNHRCACEECGVSCTYCNDFYV